MTTSKKGKRKDGGEWSGDGWKVRGPKLKLRHVAVLQTGRWMGKRANTRVVPFLLVLGYPATLVTVMVSPLVVTGLAVLATVVLWMASYRSVARPGETTKARLSVAADWATRVATLAPAYLAWIWAVRLHILPATAGADGLGYWVALMRALFGTLFDGLWFLGYAAGGVVAWALIFHAPHVMTKHVERKESESSPFKGVDDFQGARVLSRRKTRVGERYRLSIAGTGKAASDFLDGKLRERLAASRSMPAARVLITPVERNAGQLEVSFRTRDPWAEPLEHPRAPDFATRRTSITDKIVLGMEPEDGTPLTIQLIDKDGGQHVVVVAGTRGGKTTLINSVVEYLTRPAPAERDTDVIYIDPTKGKDARAWEPALSEMYAGPDSIMAALDCLDRQCALIADRARINRRAVWKVGRKPGQRAKLIILDEADRLLANPDQRIAQRAKETVTFITGKGASEAVILVAITQRGVLSYLGTNSISANSFIKIMLRVSKPGEMQYVISDWQARGMPDMARYAEGHKGVALIDQASEGWKAGRTWNLSDLDDIRRISAARSVKPWGQPGSVTPDGATATLTRELPEDGVDDPDPGTEPPPVTPRVTPPPRDPEDEHDPDTDDLDQRDPDDPDAVFGAPWASDPPRAPATSREARRPRRRPVNHQPFGADQPPARELTDRERRLMGFGSPAAPSGGWRPQPSAEDIVAKVEGLSDTTDAAVAVTERALHVELRRSPTESASRWAMRMLATAKDDQGRHVPEDFATAVFSLITTEGYTTRARVTQVTGVGRSVAADRLRVMVNRGALTRVGGARSTRYQIRVPDTLDG